MLHVLDPVWQGSGVAGFPHTAWRVQGRGGSVTAGLQSLQVTQSGAADSRDMERQGSFRFSLLVVQHNSFYRKSFISGAASRRTLVNVQGGAGPGRRVLTARRLCPQIPLPGCSFLSPGFSPHFWLVLPANVFILGVTQSSQSGQEVEPAARQTRHTTAPPVQTGGGISRQQCHSSALLTG